MPFRLSNTPTDFQEYINKILNKKFNIFVIVYLDDIFVYTKDSWQTYIDAICWVLNILQKYSSFANLSKC